MDTKEAFGKVYTQFKMHLYKEVFRNIERREVTLTTVESFCMEVIYALGRPTVNEFATFLNISSPNAAYKVNNLVKKGYLNKVQSEEDKREYYLDVTDKYVELYNFSESYVEEIMDRCEKSMTKQEWTDFYKVLLKILEEMDDDLNLYKRKV